MTMGLGSDTPFESQASSGAPSAGYVDRLLWQLRMEMDGLHRKIDEIEQLRYAEDTIQLSPGEKRTGLEIRLLLASDLIESVKASIISNPPVVHVQPHRTGLGANTNSDKREKFWNAYLQTLINPTPILSEFADSLMMGIGTIKSAYVDWPKLPRQRQPGEKDKPYVDRVKALKKQWGPPFETIGIHPLSYYPRFGQGNRISEFIEHSWKPRLDMYRNLGISSQQDWRSRSDILLKKGSAEFAVVATQTGHPDQYVRQLPMGTTTSNLSLVTEYWSPDWYQIYLDRRLVYQEENAPVKYFTAVGKSSSSRDPDKIGISVAEFFRINEPVLNRSMTRFGEAVELIVRKRLSVELPDGSVDGVVLGADGQAQAKSFTFKEGAAEALPAGAKVVDPYNGTDAVFQALPWLQMLLEIANQRGVSPLFKGVSPAAQSSGYRDNSLYLMAKSQYSYIIEQYQAALSEWVAWLEYCLVNHVKTPIYCGGFDLTPNDVEQWPATIQVSIEPSLPQNRIAEGQFMSNMWQAGHVSRRIVLEDGLGYNNPTEIVRERLLEDVQDAMIPGLIQDVLNSVKPPAPTPPEQSGPATDPNNPSPTELGAPAGGIQDQIQQARNGNSPDTTGGQGGESTGGMSRAGQARQPPIQPGTFPATNTRGL